jgi:hypothetical protein
MDDPLAALEMLTGGGDAEDMGEKPTGTGAIMEDEFDTQASMNDPGETVEAVEVVQEAVPATTSAHEASEDAEGLSEPVKESVPSLTGFGSGFAALSQALVGDMESRVMRHADVLQASALAMGTSKDDPAVSDIPRAVVERVKASLANPPYPTPPKPEKRSASDVRPIAERWVKRIKGS